MLPTNNAPVDVDMIEFYLYRRRRYFAATPFDSSQRWMPGHFPEWYSDVRCAIDDPRRKQYFFDANFLSTATQLPPETPTRCLGAWCQQMAARNILAMVTVRSPRALRISFKGTAGLCRMSLTIGYARSAINDNQTVTSTITIDSRGSLPSAGIALDLDISHTYRGINDHGDLASWHGCRHQCPGSGNDVQRSGLGDFTGEARGCLELTVSDGANGDQGTLNAWGHLAMGQSVSTASSNRDRSPIYFTGLNNDWPHSVRSQLLNSVTP